MRHEKLVPGTILIALGIIFLLQSFGVVHIHWWNVVSLWPIFIVIAGINLIFANNRSPLATVLKLGVVLLGLCILLFANFDNNRSWPNFYYEGDNNSTYDNGNSKGIVKVEGNSSFSEPYHAEAHIAKLTINGGGTSYNLSDTTNQLFEASTREFGGSYEFTHQNEDSVFVLGFKMKKSNNFHFGKNKKNTATFKLNSMPVWDMKVETGATKLDFDLSKFKVRNLTINGGAAAFDIKMGQPLEATKIDIETGVSDVHISVPKDAACRIDTDSGLSSNTFDGFNKVDDDHYETPGFAGAKKKIYIKFDGGLSGFKVNRY
jgi:hypothetical protein